MTQEFFDPFTCLSAFNFLAHKSGQNSLQQIKGSKLQRYNDDNLDLFHHLFVDFLGVLSTKVNMYEWYGWAGGQKLILKL